jgi:CheY-like chemotaxis protein
MVAEAPPALVVEDDAGMRAFLTAELEGLGYRVAAAATGEEAIALAAQEGTSLAVLDIGLPGVDGFAVADTLAPGVRVIFVTGDPVAAYAGAHTRRLDYRVLPKPITHELLEHAVRASDV